MELKRTAWILWFLLSISACIISAIDQFHRLVSHAYRSGALHWLHGLPLYNGAGTGFIYLPQSAILYIPLAKLPIPLSAILWCFISVGVFAYGIFRLTEFVPVKCRQQFFLMMSLVAIPVAFSDARNGQMNLIMAGLMFLSAMSLAKQQWNRTSFYLVLGFFLKPISIVLLLLYAVLYPILLWRLGLGFFIFLGFPFLTQHSHFVWQQYYASLKMLQDASNMGSIQNTHWAQLFNVLAQAQLVVSVKTQNVIRIIAALITLGLGYYCKRYYPKAIAPFWILVLAMIYLMLFNPRTENNTYAILAPLIGYFAAHAWVIAKRQWLAGLYVTMTIVILFSSNIGEFLIPGQHSWVSPLIACIFSFLVLIQLFKKEVFMESIPIALQNARF